MVLKLLKDVEEKQHIIAMDNYLTSIGLFKKLALKAIYGMDTLRVN